jgi:hypothetical protein
MTGDAKSLPVKNLFPFLNIFRGIGIGIDPGGGFLDLIRRNPGFQHFFISGIHGTDSQHTDHKHTEHNLKFPFHPIHKHFPF